MKRDAFGRQVASKQLTLSDDLPRPSPNWFSCSRSFINHCSHIDFHPSARSFRSSVSIVAPRLLLHTDNSASRGLKLSFRLRILHTPGYSIMEGSEARASARASRLSAREI